MINLRTNILAIVCMFLLNILPSFLIAQNTCNPSGNLIIYSNYDGGYLNINNCLFERNSARNGGALHLLRVLEYNGNNNTWRENYAELGGAIYNDESYITSELPLFQNGRECMAERPLHRMSQQRPGHSPRDHRILFRKKSSL